MKRLLTCGWLVAAVMGCTQASLYTLEPPIVIETPPPVDQSATVNGSYCASSPESLVFPVKILLILDDSGSMATSDANFRRLTASQELINLLLPKEGIFFAVENFQNAQPMMLTNNPYFTRERGSLDAALSQGVHGPVGATPYNGALSLAHTALQADINENPETSSRTRYVVLLLSDGAPTDELGPPYPGILSVAKLIKELENGTNHAGEVTIHTAYLRDPNQASNSNSAQAGIDLLNEIARIGEGEFRNFENGEAIDFRNFDVSSLARDFRTYSPVMVTNLSARLTPDGYEADSDGDGLVDSLEKKIGTNPSKRDTDGDGCGDMIEYKYFRWDPLKPGRTASPRHCDCTDAEINGDKDGDYLNDCEERLLTLNDAKPDSDLSMSGDSAPDNMIDYLEMIYNLGRLKSDAGDDYDNDGLTNLNELVLHLDPSWDEGEQNREDYKYLYDIRPKPDSGNKDCYNFTVKNVTLISTLASDSHKANENVFLLYFAEGPQDNPYAENAIRVLRIVVTYDANAATGPTSEINPDQFQLLGLPNAQPNKP